MAIMRGPGAGEDSSMRLGEKAVLPETVDVNIVQLDPIPAPREFIYELPLTDDLIRLVQKSRQEIRDVLHGRDDRLMVIVGPCSIHDPKAAMDYASRLATVKEKVKSNLLIVMRVYFEKPRTTIGWKGLINDPDIDGSFDIRRGMFLARKILVDVAKKGLPAATEFLDPITPQYISDTVSWGAIGARNTESQVHRQLASGLSMPVGFKNSTDGNVHVAADSCFTAENEHHFLSINVDGNVISAQTKGNPDCHVILRGSSSGPNYSEECVEEALNYLQSSKAGDAAQRGVVIDAAHGNCGKNVVREAQVVEELAQRIAQGEDGISGIMMESFIESGNQSPAPLKDLVYGKSITDPCISWERTEELLMTLSQAVETRRTLN